jgi:hypothetical protein
MQYIQNASLGDSLPELGKTNISSILTEALTAHVHTILADQTSLV